MSRGSRGRRMPEGYQSMHGIGLRSGLALLVLIAAYPLILCPPINAIRTAFKFVYETVSA